MSGIRQAMGRSAVISVFLSENAFWALIFSAGEVYKKECFGMLLGTISSLGPVIHLECVIPYQAAERSYSWVATSVHAQKQIKSILDDVTHLDFIGHFHSHGDGPPTLSATDRGMLKEDGFLLLIDIHKARRKLTWHQRSDGSFAGTIGHFYYRMVGYVPSQGKEKKVRLYCPSFYPVYKNQRRNRAHIA